jgi:hypothetical protein
VFSMWVSFHHLLSINISSNKSLLSTRWLCVCHHLFLILIPPYGVFVCTDGTTMSTKLLFLVVMIILYSGEQTHLIIFFGLRMCCHLLVLSLCILFPPSWGFYVHVWNNKGVKGHKALGVGHHCFFFIIVSNLAWSPSFGHACVCHCFLIAL